MSSFRPLQPELNRIRAILGENLPWSPFDFIREISVTGDKALYLDRLTASISPQNDLRFICVQSDGAELAVFAEKLEWDTEFFGYGVARLNGIFPLAAPYFRPHAEYAEALQTLLELARQRGVRYLFGYIDPRDLATLRALGQMSFALIETRAYYHMDIRQYEYKERFAVRPATRDDIPALGQTASQAVNLYDRFHADPFISSTDAARLMHKWVAASICEGFADITMVPDVAQPMAFSTVRYHMDKWSHWGFKLAQSAVLTAVAAEFRGWYRKIASEVNYHLRDLGVEHVYLGTQVTNKAVIWVLEGLGYRFGKSELIFRIVL